jgi:hypothetical protein
MKTLSASFSYHWNGFNQSNLSIAPIAGTLFSDQIPSVRGAGIAFSAVDKWQVARPNTSIKLVPWPTTTVSL